MPNIYIKVKNKVAYADKDQVIVGGNKDYKAIFEFDNEWNVILTKTARFSWGDKTHDEIFTGNECDIPRITNTNSLKVGVFVGNERATTDVIIPCKISTVDNNGMPPNPEDDVYTQILKKLDQAIGEQTAVPEGGKKGQFLGKASDEDFDTEWQDVNTLTKTDKEKLEVIKTEGSENKFLNEQGNYVEVPKDEGSGIRTLETAPTISTIGYVGEIVQVANGTAYQCTAMTDGAYTWVKLIKETDYATPTKAGLVMPSSTNSPLIYSQSNGNLYLSWSSNVTESNIETIATSARSVAATKSIGILTKYALTHPEKFTLQPVAWSDNDKELARATLGATKLYKHTLTFTFINNPEWIPLIVEAISTSNALIGYDSNGSLTNFENVLGIVTSKQITYATGSAIQPLALLDIGMFMFNMAGQIANELVDGNTCSLVDSVTEL